MLVKKKKGEKIEFLLNYIKLSLETKKQSAAALD